MKILTLCYEYPPVGGGGGRVAARVAEGLVERGHEVRFVTAGLRHLPRAETIAGVRVERPPSFRRREDTCSVPEMAMYLATSFLPALKICREWRPEVIHAHFVVPTGALAWALTRASGVPYVLTAHLGDVPGGVPEQTATLFRLLGPAIAPIWARASGVTAVSSFVAGLAKSASGVDARVILNGVGPALREPRTEPNATVRIIMLGRLSVQKDPLLAVRALSRIRDLDWVFEVIGEGPLSGEMRQLAKTEGLEDRCEFSGWLDAAAVAERLHSADLLLMTSTHEGMPMAAIEALQHGMAIVGSRIGGLTDVIEDGVNGFLVVRTPEAFSERLRELVSSPSTLQKYREGSLRKAATFSLADRVRDYEEVLISAARSKTHPSAPSRF